jgi:transforming growth factor-beta-induced protein
MCMGSDQSIVDIATGNAEFSTLVKAAQAAGLVDALNGAGPLDVYAPTDDAFAALLEALGVSAADLLANTELLKQVLAFHVVADGASCDKPLSGTVQTLLPGNTLSVDGNSVTDGRGDVATILGTVPASNGQVFIVDKVLLPAVPGSGAAPAPAKDITVGAGQSMVIDGSQDQNIGTLTNEGTVTFA